jgi:ubiquinone biosynthesis accessory factor UbiJ
VSSPCIAATSCSLVRERIIESPAVAIANHLLGQSAWARAKLRPFAGRCARFVMPPWHLAALVAEDGTFQTAAGDTEADVTVTLPSDSPLRALRGIAAVMGDAHVVGNAEFATELSFVLRNLRWDAEEDLSRLVGDIAAHRLAGAASAFAAWQKRGAENLGQNVSEYLAEEARLLTPAREMAQLRQDTEDLDRRLAALEARVKRLG